VDIDVLAVLLAEFLLDAFALLFVVDLGEFARVDGVDRRSGPMIAISPEGGR